MDIIMEVAAKYNLYVVEDAAQAIDSYYIGKDGVKKPLGSIGHLAAFSFHETKNIQSGEGGLLAINDERFISRAEIIWEKGTNRAEFFRGEVNKYGWVDTGSSFLPSEVVAAFLWAQLEDLDKIQSRRKEIWKQYNSFFSLRNSDLFDIPHVPSYSTNNGHMYFIVCKTPEIRSSIIAKLKENSIISVFHYLSLHKSKYYQSKHDRRELTNTDFYSDNLVRLPLFFDLTSDDVKLIAKLIVNGK